VLGRETLLPSWRELAEVWRRAEARGEIRGGRFVAALGGEQFALNEAVESLRRVRRETSTAAHVTIAATDPLHLPGLGGAQKRTTAPGAERLVYRDGVSAALEVATATVHALPRTRPYTS
jgi:ATP-dependent Lhr-like helicase